MNVSMESFADEMLKLSGFVGGTIKALGKHKKTLALGGAGAATVLLAQRGIQDVRLAEQIRKQQRG
jgi:hypothetical protein